jgi:hypothetical protein
LQEDDAELQFGTEHFVEFDESSHRVGKTTVPPKFGLIPAVVSTPRANLRDDPAIPAFKDQIEFIHATPLEYLERWIAANEVFEDDVRLTSVVEWSDGRISFSISQPQYHGEAATPREIEDFFIAAGWKRILDDSGHLLFYNYAFEVLAIDALPRNCYINNGNLLPFDVILCHPNAELRDFLKLY